MVTVTVSDFSDGVSGIPAPTGAACRRAIWVHTAVKRRKAIQQERRSIAGTTLIVASSDLFFLPPASGIAPPAMVRSSPVRGTRGGGRAPAPRFSYSADSTGICAGIFILSL